MLIIDLHLRICQIAGSSVPRIDGLSNCTGAENSRGPPIHTAQLAMARKNTAASLTVKEAIIKETPSAKILVTWL